MKRLLCALIIMPGFAPGLLPAPNPLPPAQLRCEYLLAPLGVDSAQPRLSWVLAPGADSERGLSQSAYQVIVASSRVKLEANNGDLWDSGRIASAQSNQVVYSGKPLGSRQQCYWKVRIWNQEGTASGWSQPTRWTVGLLRPGDWKAQWISTPDGMGPERPTPWFRKTFTIRSRPQSAFVYVASVGYHELFINGRKVGDGVLTPSASHLGKRVRYITYEVADLLNAGANCLALWLGNGWASHPNYQLPEGAMALAQLEITLSNGSVITICTDESWRTHASPLSGIGKWEARQFGGERYDARLEEPAWNNASFNDSQWKPVRVFARQPQTLSAEMIEPNRLVRTLKPAGITRQPDGSFWIDMGLSYTGWLEVPLRGAPGREITLEYSEREEEPCTYNQRDVYICSGEDRTPFRSRFNYHAFRWVTIRGLETQPKPGEISGFLIRTDYKPTATFACSSELLNRLYQMFRSTYESLSLGGYTVDCPHRERLGYGGDAHATMETGMSQFDTAAFYSKWLEDWRDSQDLSGEMPHTAPQIRGGGGPAWGGICVVLPWELYRRYGDRRILEISYPAMRRWLAFLDSKSRENLLEPFTSMSTPGQSEWSFLGDWVPPGRGQGARDRVDEPSTYFFNNCYWVLNLQLAAKTAEILGRSRDASEYRTRIKDVAAKVQERFYDPSRSTYANGEQPYLVFPLYLGLTPEEARPEVLKRLITTIAESDRGHINAGMHGTWLLWRYLTGIGRDDLLFTIMAQTSYPGWGYMLSQGATTVWEEWKGANSRLHSTLMGAGQWFTEGIGGIQPDDEAPGYKRFFLRPGVVGDLRWAQATYQSPYGEISSDWKVDAGKFRWAVIVPPNTTAIVSVPAAGAEEVTEGGSPAASRSGVKYIRMDPNRAVFELTSGKFDFECPAH